MKRKEKALLFWLISKMEKAKALGLLIDGYSDGRISMASMAALMNSIKPWLTGDVLVIKYEDLVGPRGGGTKKKQIRSIQSILEYLGISTQDYSTEQLGNQLYRGTRTFSKGRIAGWKEELTSYQISRIEKDLSDFMTTCQYIEC